MFDFIFITPEEAAELSDNYGVDYYKKLSENDSECENCNNKVWKLGDSGMCFSCTTGETDASEDYELK